MSIGLFGTFAADTVNSVTWVLADVDVGENTLLSNSKIALGWMDSNAANTISVHTIISLCLLGVQVIGLVLVASNIDDHIIFQEVDIVTLGGLL